MRLKKCAIVILIIFSFAISVVSVLYCVGRQNKYQTLLQETAPAPLTIIMVDSLESERIRILSVPVDEISTDLVVKAAMLNDQHDSILHSQQYLADTEYYERISLTFNEQESKLNTQYLLGALGVLIGFAVGIWSSIIFYTRRKMALLAQSKRYARPIVKY